MVLVKRNLFMTIAAVVALSALAIYYWIGVTSIFGTNYDEAVYVLTGQAIAEGHGYRLISQPGDPFQVLYPPLYPLLLSLVWLFNPSFPANVMAMKALNVALAVAAVALTYRLVVHGYGEPRWKGWLTAVIAGLSAGVSVILDYTMSEVAYMACVMLALWWIEPRLARKGTLPAWGWVAMAAIATLPTMARTVGIAVGLAVIAWLLLHRSWKPAALFAGTLAVLNLPWVLFTSWAVRQGSHVPPGYLEAIAARTDGFNPLKILAIPFTNSGIFLTNLQYTLAGLLPRAVFLKLSNMLALPMLPKVLGGLILLVVAVGFLVSLRRCLRIMHLYLVAYVAILMVYPFPPYTRFVAVLMPVAAYYFVEGLAVLVALADRSARHGRWLRPAAISLAAGLVAVTLGATGLRLAALAQRPALHDAALAPGTRHFLADQHALAAWSRTAMPRDAVWLNECDPCSYLTTGRKSLVYRNDHSLAEFNRYPVYMIITAAESDLQKIFRRIVADHSDKATLVYQAPHGSFRVYRLSRDWPSSGN